MRHISIIAVTLLAAGCVSAPPPPATRVVSAPPLVVPVAAPATDWRDWPRTPGDWRYGAVPTPSATYGSAGQQVATFSCDRAARQVTIAFRGPAGQPPVTIRTTSVSRVLPQTVRADSLLGSSVVLAATDPLLDAIAFSRGRFTIEQAGAAPLVLPAWAEVGRVIEDCRG